ncbi:MAG: GerAB/ArcD/ProY family transporter [Negativicutes bacterium]|nr:GerAB/ArcD/ProY family transporter [Negativicutes bacterium]
MDYNSGRMGISEGIALAFIVTFPPVFLSFPSAAAASVGSAGWVIGVPAALVIGVVMFMLAYVFARHPGDLIAVTEKLLGRLVANVVGIFYCGLLLSFAILWTREFAENTLLTALPYADFPFVVACYVISAGFILLAGIENICRATYIILPFIITGILLALAGLFSFYRPYNLLPWQGKGLFSFGEPTLSLIGLSGGLSVLTMLAPAFQSVKTIKGAVIFGYGGSVVLRILSGAVFTMVFGANVAMEKTLPFYEMTRLIYIDRYLQRFEALFILLWVMVGVLAIAVSLYGAIFITAKLFRLPTIKPLIPCITLIIAQMAMLPPDAKSVSVIEAILYPYVFAPGIIIIPVALLIATIIKGGKKSCPHTQG